MKRILVPTDFSQQAENALRVAAQIAKKNDWPIYIINLLDLPMDLSSSSLSTENNQVGDGPPESMFFMRLARQRFEKLLNKDFLKDVKVQDTVEFRGAFDGIIDGIKKYDIDLVVMGSHGASGLQEVFIGSNTEKVVRHSEVPVLVIKNEIDDFKINDFVFATDFTPKGKQAFERALDFAKNINANMHLVYINTPHKFKTNNEIEKKINKFTEGVDYDPLSVTVYNDESIEKGILNFSKSSNAQLMGIATNGRRGLAHLLNGSISEDLVNHAKTPVMTFRI